MKSMVKCLNPWDYQTIRQYDVGGVYPTLQANSNGGQNRQGVCYLILNDQGGGVMSVSKDTVSTLRAQMKHHEPIVCYEPVQCAGFKGKASPHAGSTGFTWGGCPTLIAGQPAHVMIAPLENKQKTAGDKDDD